MAKSYRDLDVWQCAIHLSVELYRLTGDFPREEIYGLTSQLRRASVSVASNIAEGYMADRQRVNIGVSSA
jgi:four helix bundle protein